MSIQSVVSSASQTLSADTDTQLTGMTITPGAGKYLCLMSHHCRSDAAHGNGHKPLLARIKVNGVTVAGSDAQVESDSSCRLNHYCITVCAVVEPAAGQAVTVDYNNNSGGQNFVSYDRKLMLFPIEGTEYTSASTTTDSFTTTPFSAETISAPANGWYLLTAHAYIEGSDYNRMDIEIGGVAQANMQRVYDVETSEVGRARMLFTQGAIEITSNQNVELVVYRDSGTGSEVGERTLMLTPIDSANIFEFEEDTARATTSTSVAQLGVTEVSPGAADDYIALFSGDAYRGAGGDQDMDFYFYKDTTQIANTLQTHTYDASIDAVDLPVHNVAPIDSLGASEAIEVWWASDASTEREVGRKNLTAIRYVASSSIAPIAVNHLRMMSQ